MSSNNQNQAMQRFFEFVFNVPGDCFCCTWSISCFLETVEHMEGDKRWRSFCTIGMSLLSLIIVFLLTLALCPRFYWSEINQIVMFNSTTVIPHLHHSSSSYSSIMNLNSSNNPYNLTIHTVSHQHIGLQLNLWHINHCTKQYINDTYYKTYLNNTPHNNHKSRIFTNSTTSITNETCAFITYRESGTTSSTQDLSLWFIILVIFLLSLGCCCVLGTHPIFDKCHHKNTALRSSIQKILAIAITILCACILNWSSFVFAAVFENQVEKYQEWQEKEGITQSNLGTGMLAVNGAMLLGIILSVIHCGAPIRTDLDINNNNNNNNDSNNDNNDNNAAQEAETDEEKTEHMNVAGSHLTYQQRTLLRRIPGSNSHMNNIAILTNPDHWFKTNEDDDNDTQDINVMMDIGGDEDESDEFKEFEYQNMNVINNKHGDDKIYNANLSMNRIRKKETHDDSKKVALLLSNDNEDDLTIGNHDNDSK